ncbi:PilZ domain-containing protein [Methylobacterium trifolii]|uniref:PilZ domain-containing protein n=1 Tax=Methylobacterium trifolii TaxID=1003092 RepID=A0ABQ4U607_9HYPH|nr:PilZ domain-containing protein [Methylobacterium trifolii]GJE62726.1 hypothetical protein MPOCJGCO_4861 [Methylobacterium trifolii]
MQDTRCHKVILPALCWSRQHHDFYAVTDAVSPDGIRFRSATVPAIDDPLTCSIRHIGVLETRVVRREANAFVVRPTTNRQRGRAVAEFLVDTARLQGPALEGYRTAPRIVPRRTDILVTLEDGSHLPSRLLNLSASGAAIHVERPLALGTRIRIGRTGGSVVRTFPQGAGIAFLVPFDPAEVSVDLVL